ncbi:MAG TPA: OmpA family protein, partial [Thiolinea sp.]|nr:OmpA family protein [Thiolinea sp.]
IHRQSFYFLKNFQGDNQPFKRSLPLLERCLKTQLRRKNKFPWLAIIALITFAGAGAWWSYHYYQHQQLAQQALSVLRAEPGLVVVGFEKTREGYRYEVLQDPQARDPASLLQPMQSFDSPLKLAIKPYLSMEPEFVLARAKQILQVPAQVELFLDGKNLRAVGTTNPNWQQKLEKSWSLIAGIESLDQTKLQVQDLEAKKLNEHLDALSSQIESLRFSFNSGSSVISNAEAHTKQLVPLILDLISTARLAGKMPQIAISGAADETGTEATNGRLAKERALAMRDYLLEQGVPAAVIAVPKPDTGRRDERSIHYQVDLF